MEVNLSLGYPRRAPQCRMLTPVLHPNFDDSMVCIGDFWAASEGLDDLIIRIGRMIAYQESNTKSPLNGLAAKWAAQNSHLLPIDPRPVAPPLKDANAEATQLENPAPTIAATPRLQSWRRSLGGEDRHRLRKLIFRLSTTMDLEIAFLLDRSEFFKSQVGRGKDINRCKWILLALGCPTQKFDHDSNRFER